MSRAIRALVWYLPQKKRTQSEEDLLKLSQEKPSRTVLIALGITAVNLVILIVALVLVVRPAAAPEVADVLRGRSLEIIDTEGRVRAQLLIQPATVEDGQRYSETVLFRLINPDGLPAVKLGSSVDSAGLLLDRKVTNRQGWSGAQILSEPPGGLVRLVGADGTEQVIQP
jgi:hypothetical protein